MHDENYYIELNYHIELNENAGEHAGEDAVREALRSAGLEVRWIRKMTPLQEGISLTETLMEGIWNHETGQATCSGNCLGREKRHVAYGELSDDQKYAVGRHMAQFLDACRVEEYVPLTLAGHEDMENIALERC